MWLLHIFPYISICQKGSSLNSLCWDYQLSIDWYFITPEFCIDHVGNDCKYRSWSKVQCESPVFTCIIRPHFAGESNQDGCDRLQEWFCLGLHRWTAFYEEERDAEWVAIPVIFDVMGVPIRHFCLSWPAPCLDLEFSLSLHEMKPFLLKSSVMYAHCYM